ncbi:Crp/Fnr family transcriptional regulator [Serpentinicella alkaliphila]|uniref:Crp/Fnr family transcriptional regulator n=1 Tax=Serpentinicella alkaliphila TaxID=1734049 RepID=A0A4V6NSB6_9FIRM|nr:Crp/Fnr family transcriptional regulator [Serpentinicella alkaliphila]QUH24789.1 Crp/Fnr family transcriptional regulator [Serpentinicella alkaliphila]TCP98983.1 Crp/Fnr family transcriptional regulator [Serpentinicella alkaliphila]
MSNQLQKSFLFKHLHIDKLTNIFKAINYRTVIYAKGSYIENCDREIGIVLSGKIEIQKNLITGKKIIMNKIKGGDVFGLANLFQESVSNVTSLYVKSESVVMFINEEGLLKLFQLDENIQRNYLGYISGRIHFLNQRVECFTQDNIEERIINYIKQLKVQQNNKKQVTLNLSKSELADYLGISRPSLYRILKKLEEDKYLILEANKIILYD